MSEMVEIQDLLTSAGDFMEAAYMAASSMGDSRGAALQEVIEMAQDRLTEAGQRLASLKEQKAA